MKKLLLFIVLIATLLVSCNSPKETLLYVGTYTGGDSEGIYCYRFDNETGQLEQKFVTPNRENPSFLAVSSDQNYLYAVSEVKESPGIDSGSVTAYRIGESGELEKINQKATKGYHPCHVSVSPDGRFVVASNYSSGSLSFYRAAEDGSLSDSFQQIQHVGSGPDSTRQTAPYAHSALFDFSGELLISADLGTDKLEFYRYDASNKQFEAAEQAYVAMNPGAGPRHFAFSPDGQFIYVMSELNSEVSVLAKDGGGFELIQSVSALPDQHEGVSYGADIHLSADGRFVYSSNRGHNSIAVFSRKDDGTLELLDTESVQGDWPRNFALSPDGGFLLVANQMSNNVSLFRVDQSTGALSYTGKSIEIPEPVCLKFLVK
ncbi:lactonase family protein [Sunxiuqinia sp. sy24]|uniref:lactonase family protein n=1 Tax=Sunxiuqinia sp. sy24 TaxID=3461495 RepID=UPI0040467943